MSDDMVAGLAILCVVIALAVPMVLRALRLI